MVMNSWFSEAWDVGQQADEERRRQDELARQNAGDIPVPAPGYGGGAIGGSVAATIPTPASPFAPPVVPLERSPEGNQPWRMSTPPPPSPSGNFLGQQFAPTPQEQAQQAQVQNIANNLGGGGLGGVLNTVSNVPLLGPAGYALNKVGINTPTWGDATNVGMNAYNTDIPVVSDFQRNYSVPFASDVGAIAGQVTDPLGIGSRLSQAVGGPSAQEAGRFAGEAVMPVTAGDFALNAALAGGPAEALTGFPLDDFARAGLVNARSWAQDVATKGLSPSMFAPDALGGREAAAVQLRGGIPSGGGGPTPYNFENWVKDASNTYKNPPSYWAAVDQSVIPDARAIEQAYPSQAMAPGQNLGLSGPTAQPTGTTSGIINQLEAVHRPNPAGYSQTTENWPADMPLTRETTPTRPPTPTGPAQEPIGSIVSRLDANSNVYTRPQLEALAQDRGIDVTGARTKSDIIERLRNSAEAPPSNVVNLPMSTPPSSLTPEVRPPEYLKDAPEVVTSPPTMFHGTGHRFDAFDESVLDQTALYGPGVYLTDSEKIADSYAANRARKTGQDAITNQISVRPDAQLINLEQPLPQNAREAILRQAADADARGTWDVEAWDEARKAIERGDPGKGVYSAFKDGLAYGGMTSTSDAGEALDGLNQLLRETGYDGLAHTGGVRGGPPHNVTILFDPKDVVEMKPFVKEVPAPRVPDAADEAARKAYIEANPLTPGQRVDQLLNEARPPESVPLVSEMPLEQQLAEAKRLGLPSGIEGELTRGTELTRKQATDLLQAHIDLEQSMKHASSMGDATDNVMRQNLDLGFESRVAGRNPPATEDVLFPESGVLRRDVGPSQAQQDFLNSPNGQASALQREGAVNASASRGGGTSGGGGNSATGGMGGGGAGANRPNLAGGNAGGGNVLGRAYKGLNDLAYIKFGGDISALRQTAGRSMNLLRLPDTIRSIKATAAAVRDATTGARLNDGLKETLESFGITPKMADWRSGADFVNRETGVSGIANRLIPGYEALNRGYATMINFQRFGPVVSAAEKNTKLSAAQLQHMADYAAIETGRGTFGKYDKQIANFLGPVMTSARYAASWPERMTYLIPAQNVGGKWTLFGPTWREAVKDQGGMIATGLGVMALSSQLGARVNYQTGDIAFGDKHYNIWGGGYGWVKMAQDVYNGTKNGKDYPRFLEQDDKGQWKGSLAEFFRNKAGPLSQETFSLMRETGLDKKIGAENITKFMSPDYWNDGVTGKNLGILDRAAQFATFLWVQDVAKFAFGTDNAGLNAETVKNAAAGGIPSFLGISSSRYVDLTGMRNDVKNDPSLPETIRGVPYSDLGPDGKAAVNALARAKDPELYDKGIRDQQESSAPAFQKHQEQVQALDDKANKAKDILLERLAQPNVDARAIKDLKNKAAEEYTNERKLIQNDKSYQEALKGLSASELQTYLNEYNSIRDRLTTNGKVDFERVKEVQQKYLAAIDQKNPDVGKLLHYEVDTRTNEHPLDKLYRENQPLVEQYFREGTNAASRASALAKNPADDAKLVYLGYESRVHSPQAQALLDRLRAAGPLR